MAERFGLDWKSGENARMTRFISIIRWEADRSSKGSEPEPDDNKRFRPRG